MECFEQMAPFFLAAQSRTRLRTQLGVVVELHERAVAAGMRQLQHGASFMSLYNLIQRRFDKL